jgi:hypothetical protein
MQFARISTYLYRNFQVSRKFYSGGTGIIKLVNALAFRIEQVVEVLPNYFVFHHLFYLSSWMSEWVRELTVNQW